MIFERSIRRWQLTNLIRVVDESGDDYVYPPRLFQRLALPGDVQRASLLAP
jgi:hypothetical protein